jgi:hypothetical protein
MIEKPTGWDALANDLESMLEIRLHCELTSNVTINYFNRNLNSCSISHSLFYDFSVGNACSQRLQFTIIDAVNDFANFKRGQKITLDIRYSKGSTITSWIQRGIFFIDSATLVDNNNVAIIAYDAIYFTQDYTGQFAAIPSDHIFENYLYALRSSMGGSSRFFSYTDAMSTDIWDYSVLNSNYVSLYDYSNWMLKYVKTTAATADTPGREVLSTVAALSGGNFALDCANKLHLYKLPELPTITTRPTGTVITASSLRYDRTSQAVTAVMAGDRASSYGWLVNAPINNDYEVTKSIAFGVYQNVFEGRKSSATILKSLYGVNVLASGVYASPLLELGDIVSVDIGNGQYYNFTACEYNFDLIGGFWGSVGINKSDSAIGFYLAEDAEWKDVGLDNGKQTPVIHFDSSHSFLMKLILLNSTNVRNTIAKKSSGASSVSGTVSYIGDDGTTKSVSITGYLDDAYFPLEHDSSSLEALKNVRFYSNNIPADAIGKDSTSSTITLKDVESSETGFAIQFQVSGIKEYA